MIQARYGWTDQHLFDLSAARFLEILDIVVEAKKMENKNELITVTFGSWQIIENIRALLEGGKKSNTKFGDYLRKLGLGDKAKDDPNVKKAAALKAKQALLIAEEIKALDRSRT